MGCFTSKESSDQKPVSPQPTETLIQTGERLVTSISRSKKHKKRSTNSRTNEDEAIGQPVQSLEPNPLRFPRGSDSTLLSLGSPLKSFQCNDNHRFTVETSREEPRGEEESPNSPVIIEENKNFISGKQTLHMARRTSLEIVPPAALIEAPDREDTIAFHEPPTIQSAKVVVESPEIATPLEPRFENSQIKQLTPVLDLKDSMEMVTFVDSISEMPVFDFEIPLEANYPPLRVISQSVLVQEQLRHFEAVPGMNNSSMRKAAIEMYFRFLGKGSFDPTPVVIPKRPEDEELQLTKVNVENNCRILREVEASQIKARSWRQRSFGTLRAGSFGAQNTPRTSLCMSSSIGSSNRNSFLNQAWSINTLVDDYKEYIDGEEKEKLVTLS